MNLLLLPYILNIIILVPVGLTALLGGPGGHRRLFQGKYPDSPDIRTLVGSLWTALLIGSIIGLIYPLSMSPLLLIQVIYKTLWLLVFVLPRLSSGRSGEIHWGMTGVFIFIILTYPWLIPWGHIFTR